MRIEIISLIIFLGIAVLPSCAESAGPEDNVMAIAIAQTVTAAPSATAQPTFTLQPAFTPLPTLTIEATLTSLPAMVVEVTATARPTYTPLPTLTPPATIAAAIAVGTSSGSGEAMPTAELSFDHRFLNIVRDYFNEMAALIFIGNRYDPNNPAIVIGLDDQLECPQYLGLYNAYHERLLDDPPAGPADIQTAYDLYVQAVANFNPLAALWAERCVVALSNGEVSVHLEQNDVVEMIVVRDTSLSLIDQARAVLESGNE